MTTLLDLFDDLGAEGFQVSWIARRDQALIYDDFRIFPLGACVRNVGLDRLERRHPAALGDTCLDQEPRSVTNSRDNLLRIEDVLDELQCLGLDPQQVRIDLAAWQNDRVVVTGR